MQHRIKVRRTEAEIERFVEKRMDILDRQFLDGRLVSEHYDFYVAQLDKWADAQYNLLAKG